MDQRVFSVRCKNAWCPEDLINPLGTLRESLPASYRITREHLERMLVLALVWLYYTCKRVPRQGRLLRQAPLRPFRSLDCVADEKASTTRSDVTVNHCYIRDCVAFPWGAFWLSLCLQRAPVHCSARNSEACLTPGIRKLASPVHCSARNSKACLTPKSSLASNKSSSNTVP